jgi:L-alanine-DL-glutamate epimerase-like enolase superfamily enzyme
MRSPEEADARDIAVTHAVRAAVGPSVQLLVDGNKDYGTRPPAVIAYAAAVRAANVYFLEEMIPDADIEGLRNLRLALRAAGNPTKLASGESSVGGMPEALYMQRVGAEPLIDIEQADMNRNGLLFIQGKAAKQKSLGMTVAPHNFGSKLGFYAQVHLGLTVPNWETSEIDDVVFPALQGDGFVVRQGVAKLTGMPGLGVRLDEARLDAPTAEFVTA